MAASSFGNLTKGNIHDAYAFFVSVSSSGRSVRRHVCNHVSHGSDIIDHDALRTRDLFGGGTEECRHSVHAADSAIHRRQDSGVRSGNLFRGGAEVRRRPLHAADSASCRRQDGALWDRRLFGGGPKERRRSLPGQLAEI